jgi:hypothetical protein
MEIKSIQNRVNPTCQLAKKTMMTSHGIPQHRRGSFAATSFLFSSLAECSAVPANMFFEKEAAL